MSDTKGIEQLYRELGGPVYRRSLRMLGSHDEAEVAVQEVFMRMLKKKGHFQDKEKTSNYLFRVTTNYCLNRLRTLRRAPVFCEVGDGTGATLATPEQAVVLSALLRSWFGRISGRRRLVIYLHFMEGLTKREIAEVTGMSRQHAGRIIQRFQRQAREENTREEE